MDFAPKTDTTMCGSHNKILEKNPQSDGDDMKQPCPASS